jgi:hypothetical protein
MKNKLFILIIFLLYSFGCQKYTKEETMPQKHFTIEQVKSIGAKYGLDSLVTEEKNGALQFFPESDLNNYFKDQKNSLDYGEQAHSFLKRTIWVNSFDDYISLLDSLPLMKKNEIEGRGGIEKFNEHVDAMKKIKWHIYRFKEGGVAFEYPERDKGQHIGTRMDTQN